MFLFFVCIETMLIPWMTVHSHIHCWTEYYLWLWPSWPRAYQKYIAIGKCSNSAFTAIICAMAMCPKRSISQLGNAQTSNSAFSEKKIVRVSLQVHLDQQHIFCRKQIQWYYNTVRLLELSCSVIFTEASYFCCYTSWTFEMSRYDMASYTFELRCHFT